MGKMKTSHPGNEPIRLRLVAPEAPRVKRPASMKNSSRDLQIGVPPKFLTNRFGSRARMASMGGRSDAAAH